MNEVLISFYVAIFETRRYTVFIKNKMFKAFHTKQANSRFNLSVFKDVVKSTDDLMHIHGMS